MATIFMASHLVSMVTMPIFLQEKASRPANMIVDVPASCAVRNCSPKRPPWSLFPLAMDMHRRL